MTENKRFIPIFDGTDKRVVGAKDNGKIISFMSMFDLMNELVNENEQLKQQLRHLEYRFTEYRIKNYKQSNRRVLDLIDKKIKEVDTIGAEVLKDLRRELME